MAPPSNARRTRRRRWPPAAVARTPFRLAVALAAALAGRAARAQDAGEGPPPRLPTVVRIEVEGSTSLTPEALLAELTTRPGRPYDPAILDNDIQYLIGTGRYRSVRWGDPVREEGGVALTLTVEERPVLATIEYRRMKGLGKDTAEEEARRLGLVAGPRQRYSEARAFRAAREFEEIYRRKGFFAARARYFAEAFEGDTSEGVPSVKLVFEAEEGGRAPIRGVRFVGNRIYADQQLWSVVRTLLGRWKGRGGSVAGFDRLAFQRVLRYIQQEMYGNKGYLDARIELAYLELFTEELPGGKKRRWIIPRVEIDEGPVYTVGRISLDLQPVEDDDLLEFKPEDVLEVIRAPSDVYPANRRLPLREGGTFSELAVEQAAWRVRGLFGHHGRITTEVRKQSLLPEEGTSIDVAFVVTPSRPYKVRSWAVRGNSKTKPSVFLRELWFAGIKPSEKDRRTGRLKPGETLDTWKLDLAERNIRFTGLVAPKIDDATSQYVAPDVQISRFPREDGTVDLTVDVNEGDTGMLTMGVGITSDDVAGQIQFVQRNFNIFGLPRSATNWTNAFTGAGQTLSLTASFGDVSDFLRVDFEEPYFLGIPVKLGLGYSNYETDQIYFHEARTGWRASLARSWSLHPYRRKRLALSASFKDEDVGITDVDPVPAFAGEEGDFQLRSGGLGISYDSRDRFTRPTEGWRASLRYEEAGGPFGGSRDFNATEFDLAGHFPVKENDAGLRSVLQFRVRISDAAGDVPLFEKYFAGGVSGTTKSLRGFYRRSVGPVDVSTGTPIPIGGRFSLLETLEYTVPLSPDDSMRGAIFYDAGNVWADRSEFDVGDQKQSAGVGLLMYPGGGAIPISLYLGWIINEQPEDRSQVLSFTIGTMFF